MVESVETFGFIIFIQNVSFPANFLSKLAHK